MPDVAAGDRLCRRPTHNAYPYAPNKSVQPTRAAPLPLAGGASTAQPLTRENMRD